MRYIRKLSIVLAVLILACIPHISHSSGNGIDKTDNGYEFVLYDLEGNTCFDFEKITIKQHQKNKLTGKAWKDTVFQFRHLRSNNVFTFKVNKTGNFTRKITMLQTGEYRFIIKVNPKYVSDALEWGIQGEIWSKGSK